ERGGEGHGAPRDHERRWQGAAPAQPRQRAAVARGVRVHHVHALAGDDARERARQRAQARERERRHRQRRLPRQPREQGVLAAPDDHPVAAAGEVLTQTEDGLCGAGGTALVRQLQDGEGPVWHRPKVVIRRLRRGTRGDSVAVLSTKSTIHVPKSTAKQGARVAWTACYHTDAWMTFQRKCEE